MRKFDKSLNGYNISQVNAFVDDVVDKVDDMINKMKEKDREIESLKMELEHYKKLDETINKAVLIAQEASESYKSSSIKESDLIINEAKKNANRIINDALMRAEKIENDSQRLRRNIITYKRRIKSLLEQQSDLVDDLDKVDIEENM